MVAVSVTIGVGLMVGSFRTTVVDWLRQTLWGDVYVSAPALTATRSPQPLDPRVVQVIEQWPSDMQRLFRDAGMPRRDAPRLPDCEGKNGRFPPFRGIRREEKTINASNRAECAGKPLGRNWNFRNLQSF